MRQAALALFPADELRKNAAVPAKSLILPLNDYPEIYGREEYTPDEAADLFTEALEELNEADRKKGRFYILQSPIMIMRKSRRN